LKKYVVIMVHWSHGSQDPARAGIYQP